MEYQRRLSFAAVILAQMSIGVNRNIDNIYVVFKSSGWGDLGLPPFLGRLIELHDRRPERKHGRHLRIDDPPLPSPGPLGTT